GCECWWRHSVQAHQHHHHHHHHISIYNHGGSGGGGGKSGASSGTTGSATVASTAAAAAAADAVLCGLEAGACFGFSAAACRTGFILAVKLSVVWIPLGLAASVGLTSSGFLLQTRGLKAGNTVVVCVAAATSSMICGGTGGNGGPGREAAHGTWHEGGSARKLAVYLARCELPGRGHGGTCCHRHHHRGMCAALGSAIAPSATGCKRAPPSEEAGRDDSGHWTDGGAIAKWCHDGRG
ncbi:hypothetical protein Vretifemale_12543, partial [Volvox reticuliferus]